jgi:hypothetical protein
VRQVEASLDSYSRSDLLDCAVALLEPPDAMHRAMYRRGVCLVAREVRKHLKAGEPKRRDLRKKLASRSKLATSLSRGFSDLEVLRALAVTGCPESKINDLKKMLESIAEAVDSAMARLGLVGQGNRPTWAAVDATPKVLLLHLSRKLFAFANNVEHSPWEQASFLEFLERIWELAGGEPQYDFGRQIDNAKEVTAANLTASMNAGDLVIKRVRRALHLRQHHRDVDLFVRDCWHGPVESRIDEQMYSTAEAYGEHLKQHRVRPAPDERPKQPHPGFHWLKPHVWEEAVADAMLSDQSGLGRQSKKKPQIPS